MGSMDGNSMLSQAIDAYSEQGVVFVSSAGNNGDVSFHVSKTFTDTIDTLRTVADFHSSGVGQSITFGVSLTLLLRQELVLKALV
jgi:hypothetical protein